MLIRLVALEGEGNYKWKYLQNAISVRTESAWYTKCYLYLFMILQCPWPTTNRSLYRQLSSWLKPFFKMIKLQLHCWMIQRI
jgi:hypothetical protein